MCVISWVQHGCAYKYVSQQLCQPAVLAIVLTLLPLPVLFASCSYQDNVQIHTMDSDGARTIRIQAQLPFSAAQVFRICYFDNHLMAEWDATVKESKLLERIDDHTNIVYNLANEIGGGVISSRDFVSLLHWDRFEDVWVSSGIACTHKDMPPQPNVVRGENGVCGFICKPTGSSPPKCSFVWYLTTDLKGWLPKSVIQRSLASVQILFIEKLEQRLASLASL
eukprot:scpid98718/ scgid3379/ StAR-related lipid transfer protein 3; MLN64-like protein; START domain-containing protein 3